MRGLPPKLCCIRVVMVSGHQHPRHMIGGAHDIERMPDDRWRRRCLVKCIARQQNMACAMLFCESGKFRQDISARLLQTASHVFGKAAERLSEMEIRRMNKFDQWMRLSAGQVPGNFLLCENRIVARNSIVQDNNSASEPCKRPQV